MNPSIEFNPCTFFSDRAKLLEELYKASVPGAADFEGFLKGRYKPELQRLIHISNNITYLEKCYQEHCYRGEHEDETCLCPVKRDCPIHGVWG
jgi:hypothetical protein